MKDVMATLREWDAAGLASAEAILIRTQHSSPRQAGARLVVNEHGAVAGAVSMGCVESDLREHLLNLMSGQGKPRTIHYGASFEPLLEVGLSCGGEIEVWIRRHDSASPAWQALSGMLPDERAVLLTHLAGDSPQVLLRPEETPPSPEMAAPLAALRLRGGTQLITTADGMWFAESIAPEPLLLIVGASPLSAALCALAALAGFRSVIVDPRRDFARRELFPSAHAVIHAWPEEGLRQAGMDRHSYVAVLAHDAKLDVPALRAALAANCHYVGLLGSAKTQADRRELLAAEGVAPAAIARIRGPIGLKYIGALEPTEIAVSILAELIMARRGKLTPRSEEHG